MGPLPVAQYWAAKPRKPIMARRPLRISFHLYLSVCSGEPRLRGGAQGGTGVGGSARAVAGRSHAVLSTAAGLASAAWSVAVPQRRYSRLRLPGRRCQRPGGGAGAPEAHGVEEAAAHIGAAHGAALGPAHALEVLGQDAGALAAGVADVVQPLELGKAAEHDGGVDQGAKGDVGVLLHVHLARLIPLGHVGAARVQQLRGDGGGGKVGSGRAPGGAGPAAGAGRRQLRVLPASRPGAPHSRPHRGQQDAGAASHGQAAVEDLGVHVPGQLLGGAAQAQGGRSRCLQHPGRRRGTAVSGLDAAGRAGPTQPCCSVAFIAHAPCCLPSRRQPSCRSYSRRLDWRRQPACTRPRRQTHRQPGCRPGSRAPRQCCRGTCNPATSGERSGTAWQSTLKECIARARVKCAAAPPPRSAPAGRAAGGKTPHQRSRSAAAATTARRTACTASRGRQRRCVDALHCWVRPGRLPRPLRPSIRLPWGAPPS